MVEIALRGDSRLPARRWRSDDLENTFIAAKVAASRRAEVAGLDCAAVDAFAFVILGALVCLVLVIWLLGKYYPGSGLEELGLKSAREIVETREALEAEDLDQMLKAHNERRRARGESEVTADEMELRVAQDIAEQQRRREAYLADRELDQLIEATNERRRKRGLPERTREQVRAEFERKSPKQG